jgi:hypothetical protein
MRTRLTLAQIYARGYCNGDIDKMLSQKLATLGSKNGRTVLHISDILAVDAHFNEEAEKSRRRYR